MKIEKFTAREGRKIDGKTLVGVHWNAHKKCWSIVGMKSRKTTALVLGYCDEITLRDVTTHIDKSKQRKVIESPTGAKDRHAFMVGYIEDLEATHNGKPVYYKPQCVSDFVDAEAYFKNGEVKFIDRADSVSLSWDKSKNRPVVTYSA